MTLDELRIILEKATKLDVAYYQFLKVKKPPYLIYSVTSENQSGSDFKNLKIVQTIRVEFYSDFKDFETESKIDNALNFVEFDKNTIYLSEDNLYMTIWEFDNILKRNEE